MKFNHQLFLAFAKRFLVQIAIISLVFEQFFFVFASTSQAADLPITPDGSTNTGVTKTASGIDQVNIAAPNASGLSHNKFTDYNVNQSGQIINNFSGVGATAGTGSSAVVQTQIGGLVTANPNLVNSGSATVILNEVTSANVSKLLGYTEIAGGKADLILSNPNGIACLGCGFINTSHLVMIAGSSNYDANGNLGFNLKEQANPNLYVPLITIDGLGLDVTRNTSTEIVASSVKLLSTIYGADNNSVTIKTGEGRYDYANKTISSANAENDRLGSFSTPVFAIDASALSKIQAGQIYLIATKQGVGVKMQGEVLASSTLNIDANGDISYSSISAGDTATLKSSQKIQTSDSTSLVLAPNLNIQASEFTNLGSALAYNLKINNVSNFNNSGSVEALNLNLNNITNTNNSGLIFGQNSLNISGANLANNFGATIYSPVDYTITLTGLLANSGFIGSGNNLTVNSKQFSNSSEISAKNNLTLSATTSATNSGSLIATKDLNFTADSLTNSGQINSGGVSIFNLFSLTNNQNSSIYSDATLALNLSSSLSNSGSISSQSDLTISGASNITNSNKILSNGDINISAASLTNNQDAIISALTKTLTATLTGTLQNDGNLNSATDLTLNINSFSNSGNILAGKASQTKSEASEEIITTIDSLGNLAIASNSSFSNSGNLQSTKNSQVNSGTFTNSGNILSYSNVSLTSLGLNNSGKITAQNNLAITNSTSSFINSGSIYGKNDVNISNSKDSQNSGIIYSDGTLNISSFNFDNLAAASIFGSGVTIFTLNGYLNNASDIQSNSSLNITIANSNNSSNSNSGNLIANSLNITSANDLENSGTIGSYNDITISAKNLSNSAEIKALTTATFNLSGNLTNTENALIYSASNLTLSASGYLSNSGEISTASVADLTFSNITNSNKILADKALNINSAWIDNNNSNSVLASVNQDLNLNITDFLTNAGTIFAKTNLTLGNETELNSINNSGEISFTKLANTNSELKVKDFTNSGKFASYSTSDDLTITASNSFDNSGTLSSNQNFTINLSGSFGNSGKLTAVNNLTLSSLSSSNNISNSGQIGAINNLTITSDSDINNSGNILANNALNISALNINNGSNVNSNAVISSLSGSTALTTSGNVNNYGEISSKTALSLSATNLFNYSNIIAATTLSVNNSGLINNSGNFQSSADTNLTSTSLTNSGTIYSKGSSTITNSSDLTNSGNIYSENNVTTTSNNLTNQSGAVLSAKQNLTSTTTNNVTNSGSIAATNDLSITAKDISNSNLIQSGNNSNIALTGNLTNNSASTIYAGNNLDITATGNSSAITNSGAISVINAATFTSKTFANSSSILANNSLTLNSNSIANNSSATLASINQDLNLNITDFLTNSGTIFAKTNLTLGNNTELNSITNSGSIAFNKIVNTNSELKVKDFTNSGSFYSGSSADSLTITSSNSFANSGTVSAQGSFTINSTILTSNSGTLNSGSSLNLNSKNLNNSGQISSLGSLTISDLGNISNSNQILASGVLTISAQNLTNSADSITNLAIASLGSSLTLNISNQLTNSGQLSSISDLTINAKNFTNNSDANVLAGAKLTQTIAQSINNSGNFQSTGNTTLTSNSLTNSGSIKSFGTSTINIASITNQESAVIFSSSDSTITSSTSLTNSGSILSNANQTINSATTTNNNQIYAVGNLNLNLSNTLTNNASASLTSLGNLTINSSSSITNNNQIASNSNLSITATALTNSNTIQSNGNLALNLSSLSNAKNILATGTFTSTTSGTTSNSGTLQSGDTFTINATSLTNSSSALILAGKDLSITSNTIINQNTKPSNSVISAGIVSSNGNVIIKTDTFNNSSGIVASKSTTMNALSAASINLNNTSGAFISTAAILLDLGNLDYTITGAVTASNVDITATNITNQGNVIANNYINLNATSGNITNGTSTGDNSDIQLSAGTYVNLTAGNNINNYATIQGTTDTTLTATNGSVNNYSTGKITGGSGTVTINALLNAFNNLSSTSTLTANNNAVFNVKDLNNNGAIDVANNLTTNITNNLNNNATALIWSGNNMTLNVANTLTNTSADIYANNNLTIQKNTFGDKLASLQNVSGNIETYSGDILISAAIINNARSIAPVTALLTLPNGYVYQYPYGQKWINHDTQNWTYRNHWCFGNYCRNHVYQYTTQQGVVNTNSISGKISSGNNLVMDSSSFTNDVSEIYSAKDMSIKTGSINNNSFSYYKDVTYNLTVGEYGYRHNEYFFSNLQSYLPYIKSGGSLSITQNGSNTTSSFLNNNNVVQNVVLNKVSQKSQSTSINGISSYTLGQTGAISVDLSAITTAISNSSSSTSGSSYNVTSAYVDSGSEDQVSSQTVKKGKSSTLSSTVAQVATSSGTDGVDAVDSKTVEKKDVTASTASATAVDSTAITSATSSASTSDTVFSGNFKINLNPSATAPVVESRSQFTDVSKFYGSTYYFNQLGLNGSAVLADIERQTRVTNQTANTTNSTVHILGDSFVENQLITNQLRTITNDSLLLSKSAADATAQVKQLLDNSVSELTRLGLNAEDVATKGLTTSQANSLTKDIVTFELTSVNGMEVLAPKIYLSQSTRDRLLNSNSMTGATSLASNSTIFGNTGLTIDAANSGLTNNGSIVSNGNLTLNVGSLTNKSTNNTNQAQIISGADLSIAANTGDIKNIGANIGSVSSLNLTALQGNILNTALVQTNDAALLSSSFGGLGGGDSYQLSPASVATGPKGNISSALLQNASFKGGEISITAANDFNNLAASITTSKNTLTDGSTSSGDLNILAGDDVNVSTLQLHDHSELHWGTKKRGGDIVKDSVTNLQSNINVAGNLDSGSVNDTTLQAANISVGNAGDNTSGNTNINAGGNLLLLTAQDSSFASSSIRKNGTFTFKNTDKGHNDTTVINNQISSTNSMSLTADNAAYVEYKSGTNTSQNIQDQMAALKAETTLVNPIDEMHKSWDQSSSGLNQTGTLVIAVAGAALTGGLGSFATVGMAALSAGVGTAGTIAATSATNSAIDGGNLGSTLKQTVKDTTSRDSLEQIAISAAAAGIATGASNAAKLGNTANAANAANSTANTVSAGERVLANVGNALARSSIYAASNIAATSAVKGQSISDSINDNGGVKQIILTTVASSIAEAGAKEIGRAAHGTTTTLTDSSGNPLRNLDGSVMTSSQINQPTQLALHGVLGATTSTLMGGDALSGAAAGVLGELASDSAYQEGSGSFNRQQSIAIGQAVGATAALVVSSAQGKSDEQTAANVGIGGFIGMNAAVNNSTLIDKSGKILKVKDDGDTGVYVENGGSGKDLWVGATESPTSFKGYDDPHYADAKIHLDTTINIEGLSQAIANNYTEAGMALDFRNNHTLDLKSSLIRLDYTGNPMDGIIRQSDGMIIPVRSAGNQTFGQAIIRNGSDPLTSMQSAGAYQQTKSIIDSALVKTGMVAPYGTSPYWGEEVGTGKDIITGYQGGNYPTNRTENLTNPEDIIRHYIEVKQ